MAAARSSSASSRFAPASKTSCSERAEIWEKTDLRVPYDEGVWYGFAVKFADPIPSDDHRYLIAQWKREIDPGADGDFSPFLALRLRQGKLFATVETNYLPPADQSGQRRTSCAERNAGVARPETNQMRALVATDAAWTAGGRRSLRRLHRRNHRHRSRQQAAGPEFRLDRLRGVHEARSGRLGPHRDSSPTASRS